MKQELPVEVPPYSTITLAFTLQIKKSGPFNACVPLYLDDGSLREALLSVRGTATQLSAE